MLVFLSTADVGGLVPPEEGAGSEVSEWERRPSGKRRGGWRRRSWVPGRNFPLFLSTPSFMASAVEEQGTGAYSSVCSSFLFTISFVLSLCDFLGAQQRLGGLRTQGLG